MGEALIDVLRPREDDGAYWESIVGTWHMPIGILLIFSLFANNVRTAGLIGMGGALIDVFRPREDDGAYWESIGGTWHMPIGTLLIFSFSRITSKWLVVWTTKFGRSLDVNLGDRRIWETSIILPFLPQLVYIRHWNIYRNVRNLTQIVNVIVLQAQCDRTVSLTPLKSVIFFSCF